MPPLYEDPKPHEYLPVCSISSPGPHFALVLIQVSSCFCFFLPSAPFFSSSVTSDALSSLSFLSQAQGLLTVLWGQESWGPKN